MKTQFNNFVNKIMTVKHHRYIYIDKKINEIIIEDKEIIDGDYDFIAKITNRNLEEIDIYCYYMILGLLIGNKGINYEINSSLKDFYYLLK